jgi:hypothetical protein
MFVGGFLSALTLIAVLQRRTRSLSPSPGPSVALRLRAIRRSRVANVEQRVEALERAASSVSAPRNDRTQRSLRPIADPDAVAALLALGYGRREAVARLAAVSDTLSTSEERVAAALRMP